MTALEVVEDERDGEGVRGQGEGDMRRWGGGEVGMRRAGAGTPALREGHPGSAKLNHFC